MWIHFLPIKVLTSPRYEHTVASIPASKVTFQLLSFILFGQQFVNRTLWSTICESNQNFQMKTCMEEENLVWGWTTSPSKNGQGENATQGHGFKVDGQGENRTQGHGYEVVEYFSQAHDKNKMDIDHSQSATSNYSMIKEMIYQTNTLRGKIKKKSFPKQGITFNHVSTVMVKSNKGINVSLSDIKRMNSTKASDVNPIIVNHGQKTNVTYTNNDIPYFETIAPPFAVEFSVLISLILLLSLVILPFCIHKAKSLYIFNNVGRPSSKEFRLSTSTRPDGLHFEGKHNLSEVSIV